MQHWGDFQAVVQLAVALNIAVSTFTDLSAPGIADRRKALGWLRAEYASCSKNISKVELPERDELQKRFRPLEMRHFDLWKRSTRHRNEEKKTLRRTQRECYLGALWSFALLWWSSAQYGTDIGVIGGLVVASCFVPMAVNFYRNHLVAKFAGDLKSECEKLASEISDFS